MITPQQDARFQVVSAFRPTGDQPDAIQALAQGLEDGLAHQVLLGVTGSGKTFTMANVIAQRQAPTLVLAHNKTLAAQLYSELQEFLPHNAVEYFVSYYDYYQPEAYIPQSDTFIEKDAQINDEIERLRLAATSALFSRSDVVIVASVSCIYGLGNPEDYGYAVCTLTQGARMRRQTVLRHLVSIYYERNDAALERGRFRVRGDVLEIHPAYEDRGYRISFFGDEVERICRFDLLTGEILAELEEIAVFPAKHFVTSEEKLAASLQTIESELDARERALQAANRLVEAQRLRQRTNYDLEMLREIGYCNGIENYSRHLDQREAGSPPWTLVDYFPASWLLIVDESHMTVPQLRAMYRGDRSRKQTLVDFGFRLPSAIDNRPLTFEELTARVNQAIYVSATPGPYELAQSQRTVEQIIRPTGLLDPQVEVRPTRGQIEDLLREVRARIRQGQRTLITTLTKRMSEDLTEYLAELDIRVHYLHSEIDTLERIDILRDLRLGVYDVVVGINLLREGLDLPEVTLVAVLDADKEGFLRSESALIQTIGRAARHVEGKAILYADKTTAAMRRALDETQRRRSLQEEHNRVHGIEPTTITKEVRDLTDRVKAMAREAAAADGADAPAPALDALTAEQVARMIAELEKEMKEAAQQLEFEKAAGLRDQILELRRRESLPLRP